MDDEMNPLVAETLREVSRYLRPCTFAANEVGGRSRVVSETRRDATNNLCIEGWSENDLLHIDEAC